MKVLIILAAVCIATAVATAGWGSQPAPPPPPPVRPPSAGWGSTGGYWEGRYGAGDYYGGSNRWDSYYNYRPRDYPHRSKYGKHSGYVPPSRTGYYPSYPYYPRDEGWGSGWSSGGYYRRH